MDAPIIATSPTVRLPDPHAPAVETPPSELAELTRQLITLQRQQLAVTKARLDNGDTAVVAILNRVLEAQHEQVGLLKAQQAAADSGARWRSFLARWSNEFPDAGSQSKAVLPLVERAYLTAVQELTEKLQDENFDSDSEFEWAELLDRYGVRLGQLGNVLNQLGPIADAAGSERPTS